MRCQPHNRDNCQDPTCRKARRFQLAAADATGSEGGNRRHPATPSPEAAASPPARRAETGVAAVPIPVFMSAGDAA